MTADELRNGRIAAALTVVAFAWAAFLVFRVAGSVDGALLAAFAIPAAAVLLTGLALHRACTTGSALAHRVGTTIAVLLLVFSVLAGFSIGFLAWYSALALVAAAELTPLGGGATAARCGPRA